jgi:uncharacterized surface protein with fasciclin (FAS1) repeats
MIKDFSKISFYLFLSLSLVFTSCDDDDDEEPTPTPSGPTQNIAELAVESPQFSILVEALTEAGLVATVSDPDASLTVFAPNDDAFNTFFDERGLTDDDSDGSRVDEAIAALGADAVTQLLLYHVIGAEIAAADVTAKTYASTASTASPSMDALTLLAEPANNTVLVNGGSGKGATVVAADIFATNGVIHEIDGVLELPTVVDHAIFNDDFSALTNAVVNAGLDAALADENATYTVFAPVNQAFDDAAAVIATLTDDQVADVLRYHVLTAQVRASGISDGPTGTLLGQDITLTVGADANDNPIVTIEDQTGGTSTVIVTDVQATNGVVHAIDRVLVPSL